jgi:E3 ubiquitin-protein ligase HUWE1
MQDSDSPPPLIDVPADISAIVQSFTQQVNVPGPSASSESTPEQPETNQTKPVETQPERITVDDLNDERNAIRENLTEKCLDVINAHGEVTFEVADLITTVVAKSPDPSAQRNTVGETLVIALMSFSADDEPITGSSGKKVAAYAHLLALLLREQNFYAACVEELKNNLETLLGFIKLPASNKAASDEPSPWIPHILLIVEMLLSGDAKPGKTTWIPPKENDAIQEPVFTAIDPSVPSDERALLLDKILEMLPRIGKDESLALAVLRILVILTRDRPIAQSMGEKKNLQRLFVMVKQVAGTNSSRIHGPLMMILRHIIEDDETIKQVMRADIKLFFDTNRQQRAIALGAYMKALEPSVIRSPKLFVEVTNEMVKLSRWSYSGATDPARTNHVVLKTKPATPPDASKSDDAVQPTVQATEDLTLQDQDIKPSTEGADTEMSDAKATAEHKVPVVENPDGVIHYLLSELLAYRNVDDPVVPATAENHASTTEIPASPANGDVSMAGTPSSAEVTTSAKEAKTSKTSFKQEFKPEEHPIYIYRCFILQCLTELLISYNRTKIEFINFKRHAPPQGITPSKPRSSVVNYILTELISAPVKSEQTDSIASRKRKTTSTWADSVLTALLFKTGEQSPDKSREPSDGDDEPDLQFVRRFVLENILKSYKEASTSSEPLDRKYSRMQSLAELMYSLLIGKDTLGTFEASLARSSQMQLARLMFEKGFIAALTASIADIDLNFPGAKDAVRKILRPLQSLTQTAVRLSELSLVSTTPGDDDGIESATESVSDADDDREETPDLFRNSTLGMFEPGREEESSSDSEDDDDEEMFEEEYGEEMDYGHDPDEEDEDPEDNISDDEDLDEEGMGEIEGLPGDHVEIEVDMDDMDDDEDDDEDDDDDDEDHDSEDDDNEREILDEAGDIQEIAQGDEMDGWESDDADDDEGDDGDEDGEEEDYEGQAQDDEEAEIMMPGGMPFAGPLGDLVRALGRPLGDPAEMLQRMDEEMQAQEEAELAAEEEEEERMGGEYMEDDDGITLNSYPQPYLATTNLIQMTTMREQIWWMTKKCSLNRLQASPVC